MDPANTPPIDLSRKPPFPKAAQAIFAARCLRRMGPLFYLKYPGGANRTSIDLPESVAHAIEWFAAGAKDHLEHAKYNSELMVQDVHLSNARLQKMIADFAVTATKFVRGSGGTTELANVAYASAAIADEVGKPELRTAAAIDVELLKWLADSRGWTDDTLVSARAVGPLWHGAVPVWWPGMRSYPPEEIKLGTMLEFTVPSDLPREEVDRLVGEMLQRFNELDHAMGGRGVRLVDADVQESAWAPVPVGCGDSGGCA